MIPYDLSIMKDDQTLEKISFKDMNGTFSLLNILGTMSK